LFHAVEGPPEPKLTKTA